MDKPDRTLGFLLHDVARFLRKRFEQNARDLGLTRSHWQVLAHLAQNEGIQQGALADRLDVEPITLGRILDRLQASDMVERRPHPSDRRVWLLYLRPAARPMLERIREIGALTKAEALEGVSEQDREKLMDILSRMRSNLVAACGRPQPERSASHG
jgi:MarR family transcriptional regulator for hemolysin